MSYMFNSSFDKSQTENMIRSAVKGLGGEYQNGTGKWKTKRIFSVTPCKVRFTFEENGTGCLVKADFKYHSSYRKQFWWGFIDKLDELYPQGHFGLSYDPYELVAVIDLEDTTRTVYNFHTTGGTSVGGFLLGGMVAGAPGAIVGGLSGKKRTYGESRTVKQINVQLLYSTGAIVERILTPKDELYGRVMELINQ